MISSSVEPVAVDLGVDEHAHEVVAGAGPAVGDDVRGVGRVLAEGGAGGVELLGRGVDVLALHHVVGPAQEIGAVLGPHAERVADHDHGQVGGDVVDEVALAVLAHGVDDLGARPPHGRLAVADPLRGEAAVDELPALEVGGVVHVDHHRQGCEPGPDAAGVREDLRVAGDLLDVAVAGDAPDGAVPVHGRVGPHPRQGVVVVAGPEVAAAEVDVVAGGVVSHGR